MTLLIIPLLTALTFLALAAGVYHLRNRNASGVRLQRMVMAGDAQPAETDVVVDGLMSTEVPLYLKPVAMLGFLLPMQMASEILKWELAQAGFRHLESRSIFAGARVLCTAAVGLLTAVVVWGLRLEAQEFMLVVGVAIAVGYMAPMMFVRVRQSKRQTEITQSLPDALDLLVICVEAGQGLNSALIKVGKEMTITSGALSEDLLIVNNEMRAGMSRTQALRNLSLRTGVDDVRALVAVLIQSDRFGTSVAQALRIHAASLRMRRRQRAEEKARKAPIKLLFPLIFCIFPALLVIILAPGMLQLFRALSQH